MHNISIPVNGSKLLGWKHNFLEKSVGVCSSYDVISQWPDMTLLMFFLPRIAQRMPHKLSKISARSPSGSVAISENSWGSCPPLHWRGLKLLWTSIIHRDNRPLKKRSFDFWRCTRFSHYLVRLMPIDLSKIDQNLALPHRLWSFRVLTMAGTGDYTLR